jgi:hypothetical protein
VERLVAFCRTGPEQARVERLERVAEAPEGIAGFAVA